MKTRKNGDDTPGLEALTGPVKHFPWRWSLIYQNRTSASPRCRSITAQGFASASCGVFPQVQLAKFRVEFEERVTDSPAKDPGK